LTGVRLLGEVTLSQTALIGLREGLEAMLVVSILRAFLVRSGHSDQVVDVGAFAVSLAALLAVGRENLETALFLYPTSRAQGAGPTPAVGAVLGLAATVDVGALLYQGAAHIDLARFFKATGAALVAAAAGVLAYGAHGPQEAGLLTVGDTLALDLPGYRLSSWCGALLKGVFNFTPQMTVRQVAVYLAHIIFVPVLFPRPVSRARQSGPRESSHLEPASSD
jgi:high-affinity iron transporter